MSINTGYDRDYSEGAAYKEYFSSDELMFPVPFSDNRLKNKDEVLIVRTPGYQSDPMAISLKYLKKKKWYKGSVAGAKIIVVFDKAGQSKAYNAGNVSFESYDKVRLRDSEGIIWEIEDPFLISHGGEKLERLPSHNIFWFAWINLFPETRLID